MYFGRDSLTGPRFASRGAVMPCLGLSLGRACLPKPFGFRGEETNAYDAPATQSRGKLQMSCRSARPVAEFVPRARNDCKKCFPVASGPIAQACVVAASGKNRRNSSRKPDVGRSEGLGLLRSEHRSHSGFRRRVRSRLRPQPRRRRKTECQDRPSRVPEAKSGVSRCAFRNMTALCAPGHQAGRRASTYIPPMDVRSRFVSTR